MYAKKGSVVESVASAAASVRNHRTEGLAVVDRKGAEVSAWLQEMFKMYKAQLVEMGEQVVANHESSPDALPEDLMDYIGGLKKKDLQRWLEERDLSTRGLKDELRERLIEDLVKEKQSEAAAEAVQKNTANIEPAPEPAVEEVAKNMDSMDISMEEKPTAVEQSQAVKDEQNMEVDDDDEVAGPVPMETVSPAKPAMSSPKKQMEDKKEASPPSSKNKMDDKKEASPQKPQAKVETANMTAVEEDHQPTTKYSPKKDKTTNAQNGEEKPADDTSVVKPVIDTLQSASPYRSASSSRSKSPLRRMQSTVQSALRNLRPVSPKKNTEAEEPKENKNISPAKPNKQVVALPQVLSTDETESSNSTQSDVGVSAAAAPAALVVPMPGVTRPFTTPAVSSTGAGNSKQGGMKIASASLKAKNDARMARIQEIRSKSKPVAPSSTNGIPTMGGLKASTSIKTAPSGCKRQNLTSQMREKAFGRVGQAATTMTAAPSRQKMPPPSRPLQPTTTQANESSGTNQNNNDDEDTAASPKKSTTPPPKQARSPVLSPLDTYELSDHGGSSDTDEEDERSRRAGKRVPNWAHKENLKRSLQRQYVERSVDPDELFGEVTTCNLEAIFGREKTKYRKRTSSGNWTRDRATVAEKLAFKRQMGFAVEA